MIFYFLAVSNTEKEINSLEKSSHSSEEEKKNRAITFLRKAIANPDYSQDLDYAPYLERRINDIKQKFPNDPEINQLIEQAQARIAEGCRQAQGADERSR